MPCLNVFRLPRAHERVSPFVHDKALATVRAHPEPQTLHALAKRWPHGRRTLVRALAVLLAEGVVVRLLAPPSGKSGKRPYFYLARAS